MINAKLAGLLLDFCLDVSKASFIGTFITIIPLKDLESIMFSLTRGVLYTIIFLYFSYKFAQLK